MSLTPNFGFNIPDSTDIVNLLTQCYPNFSTADTAMQAIKETGVTVATESKAGTVHNLVRNSADCALLWFTATSNYTTGDTFTVDGSPVSAVKVSGAGLETGDFVINSNVLAIVKGAVLTVLVGGGSSQIDASDVDYDNTGSGLTATDVQAAIDEVKNLTDTNAGNITSLANTVGNLLSGYTSGSDTVSIVAGTPTTIKTITVSETGLYLIIGTLSAPIGRGVTVRVLHNSNVIDMGTVSPNSDFTISLAANVTALINVTDISIPIVIDACANTTGGNIANRPFDYQYIKIK